MSYRLLHIYSQNSPHGDAALVGNKEGLIALRDALNRVLKEQESCTDVLGSFTWDGKGYNTFITQVDNPEVESKLYPPYTDKDFIEDTGDSVTFFDLITDEKYKELSGQGQKELE